MSRMNGKKTQHTHTFKMLHGEEADLSHIRVIGARNFVHIKDSRKLDATAWEGKVCGYSEKSKSYRVWVSKTRRAVESRNVTFIETPPHLLPHLQCSLCWRIWYRRCGISDDNTLDNDHILYDDLLRDIKNYTGVLNFTANISVKHENASGVSADLQVQGLVDQIRDLTRRDLLTPLCLRLESNHQRNLFPEQRGIHHP